MTITLRQLRAEHPHLFHPNQDWFNDEAFMDRPRSYDAPVTLPVLVRPFLGHIEGTNIRRVIRCDHFDALGNASQRSLHELPYAVDLLAVYVENPDHETWNNYIWCADMDRHSQRVYVGKNERGMEIHRYLAINSRWCVPQWREPAA